jgi:hypothetical protein
MEGYYWRFADETSGRAVVALCGVCRAGDGSWAVVALAAHPGGFVRWVNAPRAWADPGGLGVVAWGEGAAVVFRGSPDRLEVDLGPGARLDVALEDREGWRARAFGALGVAQLAPGLPQYWHPHLLAARVRGAAELGDVAVDLGGFTAYAEKNWGSTFPGEWWWGQAGLGGVGAMAAFAGGRLRGRFAASGLVVRLSGARILRLAPPAAFVTADVGGSAWRLRARTPRHAVVIEGEGAGPPHILPVPVPAERRAVMRSEQHLAGRLLVEVRRGRRTLLREESALAGLEHGVPG